MALATATEQRRRGPSRERTELALSHLDRLPALSAVAARVLSLTASDDTSARDVVEIIESDAGMTAAILRLARRPDLGVRAAALTVERAVTLLGFRAVRNAVLSAKLFSVFDSDGVDDRRADLRRGLWRHNLATACAAEMIAERVGDGVLAGEAFVCGLLHDIGKIALDSCLPKSYARVVDVVERDRRCISDVERELLGFDHTVAGKRLVARWGLGQAVTECVWLHHQAPDALPASVVSPHLVRITHVADDLVRRDGIGFSGYQHVTELAESAGQVDLTVDALVEISAGLTARTASLVELVGLGEDEDPSRYTAGLEQANRRLGELNDRLTESNRQLEVRSACYAALEHFTQGLAAGERPGAVCVADAVRLWLGADCAIAFVGDSSGSFMHVGRSDIDAPATPSKLIQRDGVHQAMKLMPPGTVDPSQGLVPAVEGSEAIWERGGGRPVQEPLWMLSLSSTDAVHGFVLVAASRDRVRKWLAAPNECRSLAAAIAMSLGLARTRLEAERMSEELLDLNRRLTTTQRELVLARSLATVGKMAAGAAHELNNPLSVISGRAQMELADCDREDSAQALRVIIEQTRRATDIVTDLMRFAKPEPAEPRDQLLSEVLEPLCQHWRRSSSRSVVQLRASLADPESTVYADPAQLREALDAVLANAVEATDAETARVQVNSPSRASDETVRIVVEDNGTGMTREVVQHAFDPFFSSRPAGRGRGLGLSRAYRLIEINGGRMWIDSTPQVGTTVTLELPARAPATA